MLFNSSLWHCASDRKVLGTLLVCRTAQSSGAGGQGDSCAPSALPGMVARARPKGNIIRGREGTQLCSLLRALQSQQGGVTAPRGHGRATHAKDTAPLF